jgi:hypothetical protein
LAIGTVPVEGRIPTLAQNLSRKHLSETLYRALVRYAPQIASEPAVARFVLYYAFGTFHAEGSRRLVLPTSILADIAGVPLRGEGRWERGHRWESGDAFLDWLRTTAFPGLDVSGFYGAAGFARELRTLGLPAELDALITVERATPASERGNVVDPVSGRPVGKRTQAGTQAVLRGDLYAFAQSIESERAPDHPATRAMLYMNGRSPRLLSRVVTPERIAAAYASAQTADSEGERTAALASVRRVEEYGAFQPYKTASNTVRIVPATGGLNGMRAEERNVLLDHPLILKVDLAKAHLGINAALYDVTRLLRALRAREVEWAGMLGEIGAEPTPGAHGTLAAVKRATYGLANGGTDDGCRWTLTGFNPVERTNNPTGITREQADAFLDLELNAELRRAMERARQDVEARGGARDAFGDWISLDTVRANLERKGNTTTDAVRSVVAQVAQSWEVVLMLPILDAAVAEDAKAHPDWEIAVWLWDGLIIKVRRAGDAERIGRDLARAVDRHAEALGIPTFLEVG